MFADGQESQRGVDEAYDQGFRGRGRGVDTRGGDKGLWKYVFGRRMAGLPRYVSLLRVGQVCGRCPMLKHMILSYYVSDLSMVLSPPLTYVETDPLCSVEKHLGVQIPEKHQHSPANQILLEGSRRLGYAARVVPQNIRGSLDEHAQCGAHCTFGCRADDSNSGSDSNGKTPVDGKGKDEDEHDTEKPEAGRGKISGCRAFLAPLIEQGLKGDGPSVGVITGFEVDEVLWDEEDEERAVGVVGWLRCDETGGTSTGTSTETTREKVCVLAEMVVLGAGTMHTPAILMRSGVKVSGVILRCNLDIGGPTLGWMW